MKFKILASLFLAIAVIYLCSSFKPQATGQVYFMRSTGMEGTIITYKVYLDDTLVCHLKNNHYSLHAVTPGEHTVSIQNTGLGNHKKSRPFKIKVVAGKSNYLSVKNQSGLGLDELAENSGLELLKKVLVTEQCLTAKDKN